MYKKALKFCIKWFAIFFVVSVIAFMCPRLMPGNPAQSLLEAYQMAPTEENIAIIEKAWGLDQPLPKQYIIWISNFVRGDWGYSLSTKLDIRQLLMKKLPYSIAVGMGGLLLSSVLAWFLGYRAALKENGICDFLSRFLSLFSLSVPSFIFTVILVYFLGVRLGIVRFFTGDGKICLLIAVCVMALYMVGPTARVMKTHFKEQMASSYVTFAVSRGFNMNYVLLRHTWKPVLCGLISVTISKIPAAFGGSSILEYALGIPGISYFLVESMHSTDYYVLQSYIMVVVICVFLSHLVLNLILSLLEVKGK